MSEKEKAGAADCTDWETKRACRIATLRGLLNFHRRSTMACRTEDGTSPGELIADMYTDALEAAIEALTEREGESQERMWQLAHTCVKAATEKKPDVTFGELATAALLDFIPKGENELRDAMWSTAELAGAREEEITEIACFLEEITKDCALYWAGKQGFLKQRVTQIWEFPECYDENTGYR